jgi:5'-nucleotidase/UDP-sugar diphosphatase
MTAPRFPFLAPFLVLFATPARAGEDKSEATRDALHLVVLHTNDVHGQVLTRKATWLDKKDPPEIGGLPRVAAFVSRVREEARAEKAAVVVVDAGDWFQGTPEGLVDQGRAFAGALAMVGYDALAVGNHDFDYGVANLVRLLEETKLPAVCANIELREGGARVGWVPPARIVETGGLRIALVGLVTTITPEIVLHHEIESLRFVAPAEALARAQKELPENVDLVLPLSHCGVEEDRVLARARPELPLIVGGHSHTYLKEGVREGSTLIVQTGSKASAVGRVDLWLDRATKQVIESRARVFDLLEEPDPAHRNAALEERCRDLESRGAEAMAVVLGELTAPAHRSKDPLVSGSAGNLLADLLRERMKADVGLMNRGGIRADLEAGPLTRRAVFEIQPFDNSVSVVTMSGAELFSGLRRAVEGAAHSGLEVSGVTLEVARDEAGKRELVAVKLGDKPLDPKANYRVAMNSFMSGGGDAYFDREALEQHEDDPILIRDLLEQVLVEKKKLTPSTENRYVTVKKP